MNSIRTISTRIDSFLKNADLTNSPTLQAIYQDYCCGIEYINSRLILCEDLLEKGKLGEAIILADKTPSLFDLVPLIQAPNIVEFFDVCQIYGLNNPPLLQISIFKSLENATDKAEVKEGLFAELRKLSRTTGSEEKVLILRKIIKLEPDNNEWKRQLQQAEASCVPALIKKSQQAIIDKNYAELENLEEALSSHEWDLVIPDVVIDKIHRVLDEEHQHQLRNRAKSIINEANKAYATQNLIDYNRAHSHWKMLCNIDHYLPSEEESHQFSIAESFFQERQKTAAENEEYNNTIRNFNALIQSHGKPDFDEINMLYKHLATFNKPIPENISVFVNQQFRQMEKNAQTRTIKRAIRNLFFCLMILLVIVVGSAGTWFAYNSKRMTKELAFTLKNNDLNRSKKIISSIRNSRLPYLFAYKKLRDLNDSYDQQQREFDEFQAACQDMEQALESQPKISEQKRLENLLDKCRRKAVSVAMKQKLSELENLYEEKFIAPIKENRKATIKTHLGNIRNNYNEYRSLLDKDQYLQADEIYKKFLVQLKDLRKIAYFDIKSLSSADKNMITSFSWLLDKHKRLYYKFSSQITKITEKTFSDLRETLSLYKDNEKALLMEGPIGKITANNLPMATELEKKYTFTINNFELQKYLKDLNRLKKEILQAIENNQIGKAEKINSEFKALFAKAGKISPVSESNSKILKNLDLATVFSRQIADKKALDEVKQTFKRHVCNMYDHNSKNALLAALEKAERSRDLTLVQQKMLKDLRYQLQYLKKIDEFHKNPSTAIWKNQSYPFFRDIAQGRLFVQKDKEFFEEMKNSINDLAAKYKNKEKIYIAFRDGKGRVVDYTLPYEALKKTLKVKAQKFSDEISFEVKNKKIKIQGHLIAESSEESGVELSTLYKNVTFLYPSEISKENLLKAISPDQKLIFSINEKINKLPATLFSMEYYKLIVDLHKEKLCSRTTLWKIYKLLLSPIEKMGDFSYKNSDIEYKPFNNPSTKEFLSDIFKLKTRIERILNNYNLENVTNVFDDNYYIRLSKIDFKPIERFITVSKAVHEFRTQATSRSFRPAGVVAIDSRRISFTPGDNMDLKKGEIWIFDTDGKMMLAGLCDKGKIIWNDISFQNYHVSVVFQPLDEIPTVKKSLEYKSKLSEQGVESIQWPEILPENVR